MDVICRLCLGDTTVYEEYISYDEKIQLLMPEIDLNITPTFILCEDCSDNLNRAYTFKQKCLQIEERIQNYTSATQTLLVNLQCVRDKTYCDEIKVKVEEEFDDVENNSIINPTNSEDYKDINSISEEYNLTFPKEEIDHPYKDDCVSDYCKKEESLEALLCEICTKSFKTPIELDQHHIVHSETNKFPCDSCNKVFSRKIYLTRHKIIHSEEAIRFFCDICDKGFKRKQNLDNHKHAHTDKTYTCSICSKSYRNLQYHMRNCHIRKHICQVCGMKYGTHSILLKHMRIHRDDRPFKCNICQKGFIDKYHLSVHKIIHSEEEIRYFCDICNKGFKRKQNLDKHKHTHTDKTYTCSICSKSYRNLQYHMRNCHIRKHICQVCGLKYGTQSILLKHMRIHTGNRPFKCDICQKEFTEKDGLSTHMRSHRMEKPHVCNSCGKAYKSKAKLKGHMIVHMPNSKKPFVCEVTNCNRRFETATVLGSHIRRHPVGNRYHCSLCDKSFFDLTSLKGHMRSHTGEKPYKCDICQKSFTYKCSLRKHFKSHRLKKKES